MKSFFCVAVIAALAISQASAQIPKGNPKPKETTNNLINQTKGKFNDLSSLIKNEGLTGAWSVIKKEAVQETQYQVDAWYERFDFKLRDFQIGMAAGVVFGVLEFAFREVFPTWSWVAYAYKLNLGQTPVTLLTILSKIGLEVYHQTRLFTGNVSDTEFTVGDILLSAISLPVLLLIGNQNYLLGLAFIEFGKQVALINHPHYHV